MRTLITRKFDKLLKNEKLNRNVLKKVIADIIIGNTISLGKKLFKTRMKAPGRGKSGGYRTITFYKINEIIILIFLFAKNDRENVSETELKALKLFAVELDNLKQKEIDELVKNGSFIELHF